MRRKSGRVSTPSHVPPFEFAVGPPPVVHYGPSSHRPVLLKHPQTSRNKNGGSYHDDQWQVVQYDRQPPAESIRPVHMGVENTPSHAIPTKHHSLSDREQSALFDSVKNLLEGVRQDEQRRGQELLKAGQTATRGSSYGVLPSVYQMDQYRTDGDGSDSSVSHWHHSQHKQQQSDHQYSEESLSNSYASYNQNHYIDSAGAHYPPPTTNGASYGAMPSIDYSSDPQYVQEEYWPETPWPVLPQHMLKRQRPFGGSNSGACNCATYNNIGAFAGTTTLILNAVLFVLLSIANGGAVGRQLTDQSTLPLLPQPTPEISHQALRYACDLMGYTDSAVGDHNFDSFIGVDQQELFSISHMFNSSAQHLPLVQLLLHSNSTPDDAVISDGGNDFDTLVSQDEPDSVVIDDIQAHDGSLCNSLCIETVNGIFPIGISTTTENAVAGSDFNGANGILTLADFPANWVPDEVVVSSQQSTSDEHKSHITSVASQQIVSNAAQSLADVTQSNDTVLIPSDSAGNQLFSATVDVSQTADSTSLYQIQNQTIITANESTLTSAHMSLIENLLINSNLTLDDESKPLSDETNPNFLTISNVGSPESSIEFEEADHSVVQPLPSSTTSTTTATTASTTTLSPSVIPTINSLSTSSAQSGSSSGITVPHQHQGVAITLLDNDAFLSSNGDAPETSELPARPNFSVVVTKQPNLAATVPSQSLDESSNLIEEAFSTLGVVEQTTTGILLSDGSTLLNIEPITTTTTAYTTTPSTTANFLTTPSASSAESIDNENVLTKTAPDEEGSEESKPLITAWGDLVQYNELGFWKPSRKPFRPLIADLDLDNSITEATTKLSIETTESPISIPLINNGAPVIKEGLINSIPIRILETKPAFSATQTNNKNNVFAGTNVNKIYGKKNPASVDALFSSFSVENPKTTQKQPEISTPKRPVGITGAIHITEANSNEKNKDNNLSLKSSSDGNSTQLKPSNSSHNVSFNRYGFWKPKRKPISLLVNKLKQRYLNKKRKTKPTSSLYHSAIKDQFQQTTPNSIAKEPIVTASVSTTTPLSFMNFLNNIYDGKNKTVNGVQVNTDLSYNGSLTTSDTVQSSQSNYGIQNLPAGGSNADLGGTGMPLTEATTQTPETHETIDFNEYGFWKPTKPSIQSIMSKWKRKHSRKTTKQSPGNSRAFDRQNDIYNVLAFDGSTFYNDKHMFKAFSRESRAMDTVFSAEKDSDASNMVSEENSSTSFSPSKNNDTSIDFEDTSHAQANPNSRAPISKDTLKTVRSKRSLKHEKTARDSESSQLDPAAEKFLASVVESVGRSLGSRKFIPRSDITLATQSFRHQFSDIFDDDDDDDEDDDEGVDDRSQFIGAGGVVRQDRDSGPKSLIGRRQLLPTGQRKQQRRPRSFSSRCVTECWLGTVGLLGSVGGLAALAIPVYALIAANSGGISLGSGGGGGGGGVASSAAASGGGNSGGGGILAIGPIVFGDDPGAAGTSPLPVGGDGAFPPASPVAGDSLSPAIPPGADIGPPAPPVAGDSPFFEDGVITIEPTLDGTNNNNNNNDPPFQLNDQIETFPHHPPSIAANANDDYLSFSDSLSGHNKYPNIDDNKNNNNNNGGSSDGSDSTESGTRCDNYKLCLLHTRTATTTKRDPPRWYFSTYDYDGSISDLCREMAARPTEALCKKLFPHCSKNLRPL